MHPYLKLSIAAILPALVTFLLYLFDRETGLLRKKPIVKNAVCGIAFGALAVLGNEWGIPIGDTRLMRRLIRRGGLESENGKKEIELYRNNIVRLLGEIDTPAL